MIYRAFVFLLWFMVAPVAAEARTLLVLGDSLSAAYGMPLEQGWVALLEERIHRQGLGYKVVNASISGETTLGARARLAKLLAETRADLVIVELGGNDGLRGFPLPEIERNLSGIIRLIQDAGGRALLVPMQLPPNYGAAYNERFRAIYHDIAERLDVRLSAFILRDIAEHPELMQADGIHPTAAAQARMLDNIWPGLLALMRE